jgi:LuxR family transcriptional regulator, maltose regulon positive regulatory protein
MDRPANGAPRTAAAGTPGTADAAQSGSTLGRFPFTKFLAPVLGAADASVRLERLARALRDHRIVLVRAPAGSGKTTLLAAWAAHERRPVAWLRVDAGDVDVDILAVVLHHAVARVAPSVGRRVPGLLAGRGVVREPRTLAAALVNDLATVPELALVLDDAHAMGPGAARLLALLVDLLPSHVRLLVASRAAPPWPLARLRVRGELGELGASDLRLELDDVRRALARQGVDDEATASRVLALSGGWAAAVRLATNALSRAAPSSGTDDRRGDRVRDELWAYLAEEVLAEQSDDLRDFLLETSVLTELEAQVCAAVTGRDDAADLLAELEARDLFIARFDRPDGEAWRFHDLFAGFLRDRLRRERDPATIADLHRRAANALPPVAAVPHLFAAGEPETAAARMVTLMLSTFDSSLLPHLVPWLDQLPAEVVSADPRIALLRAWHADLAGRGQEARAIVEPTWRQLVAEGRDEEAIDLGLQLVGSLLSLGDMEACDEVLRHLDRPDLDPPRRVVALVSRMWREWSRRDTAAMAPLLEAAVDLALREGEGAAANVLAASLTSPLLFVDPGAAWLLERAQGLDARLQPHDETARLQLRTLRAAASLLALDVAGAEADLRAVLAASERIGRLAWTHQDAEALLLTPLLVRGECAAVLAAVDAAAGERAASPVYERWWPAYAYPALRAATPVRNARALRALTRRYLPDDLRDAAPSDAIARGVAAAWLAVASGSAPDGREPLEALAAAEEVQWSTRAWLGHGLPGLERGSLLLEAGRASAAVDAAEATLDAAARYGAGILLADVEAHRPLLARCAAVGLHADLIDAAIEAVEAAGAIGTTRAIPDSGEALTAREVDVLRLVARGLPNRDVAAALGIAEATVKTHLTRVLGKLGATSRTHAVARARELRLL